MDNLIPEGIKHNISPDPFGMITVGRDFGDDYRFGFQNQEVDKEFWNGAVTFKYRIEDARIGRFFSIDPLTRKYEHLSPYAFSENKVIQFVEFEGLETKTPQFNSSYIIQSLWRDMGIYNEGDLQHVTNAIIRKDARHYAMAYLSLMPVEELIFIGFELTVEGLAAKWAIKEAGGLLRVEIKVLTSGELKELDLMAQKSALATPEFPVQSREAYIKSIKPKIWSDNFIIGNKTYSKVSEYLNSYFPNTPENKIMLDRMKKKLPQES